MFSAFLAFNNEKRCGIFIVIYRTVYRYQIHVVSGYFHVRCFTIGFVSLLQNISNHEYEAKWRDMNILSRANNMIIKLGACIN